MSSYSCKSSRTNSEAEVTAGKKREREIAEKDFDTLVYRKNGELDYPELFTSIV